MLTYKDKFKDRTPEATIEIIDNYFHSLGMYVKPLIIRETECGTWYSRLQLRYKDFPILAQNGKGTSKNYCLASGYGELYERFCAQFLFTGDPFLYNDIINNRFKKYGYYIHPEEKEIGFQDTFISNQAGQDFLNAFSEPSNKIEKYCNLFVNNKYIGVPFINAKDPDKKLYLDPRLTFYLHGSSGLACGNTFFEAFVQGMSEIYEHYVTRLYWVEPQEKYYCLNLESIQNPTLQSIIKKIESENDLYILDLSYNFNVPVLMSLIVNKYTHAISVNLGSSPVFDIALERILTELYQGFDTFNTTKLDGQIPAKVIKDYRLKSTVWPNSEVICPVFPENILTHLSFNNDYNHEVFLFNNSYSNEQLYNYQLKINELNNFDIYYFNRSGCKDMYAIELFDIQGPQPLVHLETASEYSTPEEIEKVLDITIFTYDIINNYMKTHEFNFNDFDIKILKATEELKHEDRCHLNYLLNGSWFIKGTCGTPAPLEIFDLINGLKNRKNSVITIEAEKNIQSIQESPHIYQNVLMYMVMTRYACESYSLTELLDIFTFLKFNFTSEDIIQLNNDEYWLKKILLTDIDWSLESEEYDDYIEALSSYQEIF